MASVTSLDSDMRKLRMERNTQLARNEIQAFIEESLGERIPTSDTEFFLALKDGVVLCRLVNLAVPDSPVRFKTKAVMPFVQMENISMFLQSCEKPPLSLQAHDVFSTVDLYEKKDPAQVIQCLGAFSRAAHRLNPSRFPNPIGGKSRGVMSPQGTGTLTTVGGGSYGNRGRGFSSASNNSAAYTPSSSHAPTLTPTKTGDSNSGRRSPTKNGSGSLSPGVSSWSKKADEGSTAPAWNIAQYGYMGGASQGNLGVSFGGRRQITSAGPSVPSLVEKEKKRREKEAEEERLRAEAEKEGRRKHAEEEKARIEEEERWAEKERKLREEAQEEKRRWEEQDRTWKSEEEMRLREEREAEARMQEERRRARGNSDARLQGQFLSQYQAQNGILNGTGHGHDGPESSRVRELERELELAREREREYEREKQAKINQRSRQVVEDHDLTIRMKEERPKSRVRSRSRPQLPTHQDSDENWRKDERDYLRNQWNAHHDDSTPIQAPQPSKSPRPLPEPTTPVRLKTNHTGPSSRPLPDPAKYTSPNPLQTSTFSPPQNRTDRFLLSNPAPQQAEPQTTYSNEIGGFDSAAERDAEDRRRLTSQTKTKAGGWASKSLLEREMEMERQRQQEWEESQKEIKSKVPSGDGVDGIGGGLGGKWDVNQWTGYTGGDGQNKGTQGIGSGRRQIVGPRPPPTR
ncbi:hypothetical protein B7494_g5439 [Chlorociboria aeruginascens]|nr:hypothetical protein B7494_g5439 [Chlorociboria aeruginascens]